MRKVTIDDFIIAFENRKPRLIGSYSYYSVLVPLVEKDGDLHILYEVRSDKLLKQPGEVCFPGGRMEKDETAEECAVRETSEELNIPVGAIKVIAPMDYMHTYSNFTMYAFLGVIDYEVLKNTSVNTDEVKEIFLVPVAELLEMEPEIYNFDVIPNVGEDFPYEKINSKTGYNWRKGNSTIPIYQYGHHVIWGLTGRITCNLLRILTHKHKG